MARYKVPQDVEADDKLLGPFSFRQFVYLMITAGLTAAAVALFQLFPFLAILPVPFAIFFAVLALPLKKDQPMETYLVAIVSYYLKPSKRIWVPGQRESTIIITAPKKVEAPRVRAIDGEEASRRLSFLANVIDSEGYSIRDTSSTPLHDDFLAENRDTNDIFDNSSTYNINTLVNRDESARKQQIVNQMREAIARTDAITSASQSTISHSYTPFAAQPTQPTPINTQPLTSAAIVQPVPTQSSTQPFQSQQGTTSIPQPITTAPTPAVATPTPIQTPATQRAASNFVKLQNLANNSAYSVSTLAQEAHRVVQQPHPTPQPQTQQPQTQPQPQPQTQTQPQAQQPQLQTQQAQTSQPPQATPSPTQPQSSSIVQPQPKKPSESKEVYISLH